MTTLAELIERLEKSEGPSLELDGMIWCAVNGYEFVMWDGAGCVYSDPNQPNWNRGIQHADASTVRPYSASIESGMKLATGLFDNGAVDIEVAHRSVGGKIHGRAEICGPHAFAAARAATPALALVLATLKALEATR